jgi:archaellum component FlaC
MDQELVQYLDERFGRIEQRLDRHDQRFEQIDRRFVQIDRQFERIGQPFVGIDRHFDEVNDRVEEVKRHNGVLIEDLRCQVRLVAEGFATFVEGRYAQDQARIDERFNETQALLRTSFEHLTRQDDQLRQRVENLERNRPN